MANAEEYKNIVANNLAKYRKAKGLTQAELAEKLNYSDKSISKWERGEGFPDIFTLKELADFFGIKVDDFYIDKPVVVKTRRPIKKEIFIPLLALGIGWLVIATLFAIAVIFFYNKIHNPWLIFLYGVVMSGIILTVFSAYYHHKTVLLVSESIIVWGVGLSIFFTTGVIVGYKNGLWLIYVVCGVVEVLGILYYIYKNDKIKFKRKKTE